MAEAKTSAVGIRIEAGVARVTLARAERHNAFDERLIAELTRTFERLGADPEVRVVVLAALGQSFSAGADLDWMKRAASHAPAENLAEARNLARLLHALDALPRPTVALVQGAAYGGGAGLVAACDVAIAAEGAVFAFTETKLGLIPAVISPYVFKAIGGRAARRYFLTAETFDAGEALRLGLVHMVVPAAELEAAGRRIVDSLLANGPQALAAAKKLIAEIAGRPIEESVIADTARRIAEIRAGAEGREGVAAFLEKRRPRWRER